MKLDFDLEKLQAVADDFYRATGIGLFIIGADFSDTKVKSTRYNPYCALVRGTERGRERCVASDSVLFRKCSESKKAEIHVCHGGLVNIAAPIMYEGTIIGYVSFSSLRSAGAPSVGACLEGLGIDEESAREHYSHVPIYNEKRMKSVINLALMLIQHVVLVHMIKPSADENLQRVKAYIKSNLRNDLSVKSISVGTNISKSVLYRLFNKSLGGTVSEYVNRKRVEAAEELLVTTSLPVSVISEMAGFSSVVHFRNMFKKLKGVTPLHYRKQNEKTTTEKEKHI